MEQQEHNFFKSKPKRTGIIIICGALILVLGIIVFAVSGHIANLLGFNAYGKTPVENNDSTYNADELAPKDNPPIVGEEYTGKDGDILVSIDDNGNARYSTDGGKTWNENPPAGIGSSDGSAHAGNGKTPEMNEDTVEPTDNMSVKSENGKTYYSTDDGKTWNDKVPGQK